MFEILTYDFMIRAFIAGIIIAITAPVVGTFLVVRRFSLVADTLAHVSLVGVALGILFNVNPFLAAIFISLVAVVGIEKLRVTRRVFEESILALVLSGSLALAVVLLSLARGVNVNLVSYLFGSITTVSVEDITAIGLLGVVVIAVVTLLYKEFFLVSFDEDLAEAQGLPVARLNLILISLVALTVSLSLRVVGALLTGALMVIPVMTAMQWAKSFKQTVFLSVFFSLIAVIVGLFSSYYLDIASGGTIVLIALIFFLTSIARPKN